MIKVTDTKIKDIKIIESNINFDERGYFFESYNKNEFQKYFKNIDFIQDNESESSFGVLRGMHFQKEPYSQAKLVRVLKGEIQDVAVDLRKGSNTYLKYFSINLSNKNKKQLYIPRGFAHGFLVLSSLAIVSYKVDCVYYKNFESGVRYDHPKINIKWDLNKNEIILSDKDKNLGYEING